MREWFEIEFMPSGAKEFRPFGYRLFGKIVPNVFQSLEEAMSMLNKMPHGMKGRIVRVRECGDREIMLEK